MWQDFKSMKALVVALVLSVLGSILYFQRYNLPNGFVSTCLEPSRERNQTIIDLMVRQNVSLQARGRVEEDGPPMPQISKYRQRFLLWYQARPDIAASIGPDVGDNSSRYLIYRCDSGRMTICGGWIDRVKGMIAGYIIANLTGRIFKIEHLNPDCRVERYLLPNVVNWSLPVPFHQSLENVGNDTALINWVDDMNAFHRLGKDDIEKMIGPEKYVYFKTNLDHTRSFQSAKRYENQLSWMKSLTQAQIMAAVYKRLFVLHPRLQTRLQNFLARALPTPGHRLICAHVRMGANPTIPKDTQVINSPNVLPNVWKFLSDNSKADLDKVFLMSDSESTLQEAQRQPFAYKMVSSPGPVAHIERSEGLSRDTMCDAQEKVIFDQHVLMNCDVILGCNSGLSKMAAYVRETPRGQFCLIKNGTIIPCSPNIIMDVYVLP